MYSVAQDHTYATIAPIGDSLRTGSMSTSTTTAASTNENSTKARTRDNIALRSSRDAASTTLFEPSGEPLRRSVIINDLRIPIEAFDAHRNARCWCDRYWRRMVILSCYIIGCVLMLTTTLLVRDSTICEHRVHSATLDSRNLSLALGGDSEETLRRKSYDLGRYERQLSIEVVVGVMGCWPSAFLPRQTLQNIQWSIQLKNMTKQRLDIHTEAILACIGMKLFQNNGSLKSQERESVDTALARAVDLRFKKTEEAARKRNSSDSSSVTEEETSAKSTVNATNTVVEDVSDELFPATPCFDRNCETAIARTSYIAVNVVVMWCIIVTQFFVTFNVYYILQNVATVYLKPEDRAFAAGFTAMLISMVATCFLQTRVIPVTPSGLADVSTPMCLHVAR